MDTASEVRALAERYLEKVKPSGPDNIMAICPFHVKADGTKEKTPSFAMSLSKGLFFCHSCQMKGSLTTFLREFGMSPAEVERKYGLLIEQARNNTPPKPNPLDPKLFNLSPLPESLLGVFNYCPTSLIQAGFTEKTLLHFDVGFDMQHTRITYPLRNLEGHLVGISGRTVGLHYLRYKIYTEEYAQWGIPNRPEPDKRALLYNVHDIYPACYFSPNGSEVVVVEGFKACMWVWQAGIKNVVALLGTYLSQEQQWILEHMGATVYLFLDNNPPGRKGVFHAGEKLTRSLRVKVMDYPERLRADEDAQPDSLTPEEVLESKAHASEYLFWRLGTVSNKETTQQRDPAPRN